MNQFPEANRHQGWNALEMPACLVANVISLDAREGVYMSTFVCEYMHYPSVSLCVCVGVCVCMCVSVSVP